MVSRKTSIVYRERFAVMGCVMPRKQGTEPPETFVSIWNEFERNHERIKHHSVDSRYYGVSFGIAEDGRFDYLAGMAVVPVDEVPEGLQVREVPAGTYAVFSCSVQAIGQTYGYIFGEWRSTSGYELDTKKPAFEEYPPAADATSPVRIHIPIREEKKKASDGQPGAPDNPVAAR